MSGRVESPDDGRRPVIGVSVALWRDGKVLLVRRGRPPYAGAWSFPGGKVRFGEALREAALRELAEETGLSATIGDPLDAIEIVGEDGGSHHYVLIVFRGTSFGGAPHPGDDASALGWFSRAEAAALPLAPGTLAALDRMMEPDGEPVAAGGPRR